MVIDGISQVNNHGGNQPKNLVKKKITLLLHEYNRWCITKSSTSFHPVDSPDCSSEQGGSLFKESIVTARVRNIWYKLKKWLQYRPEKKYFRG
jgi:hypothetical protein